MSSSSNAEHFFQTSTSIAESERKQRKAANTFGQPIKLSTKLLAIAADDHLTSTSQLFLAGADGTTCSLDVSTNEVKQLGKPATAPMTCVLRYCGLISVDGNPSVGAVFAGGWNKYITSFYRGQVATIGDVPDWQASFKAHDDFVKCLLVVRLSDQTTILLSGGADGDIHIWTPEGKRLASLRPQSRGIECIALDPLSNPDAPRVFFSTSQRDIYSFVIPPLSNIARGIVLSEPIIQHETSVYKLQFDHDGDLWTASADKTAKRLVRENNFVADTTFVHPDFVRDIVLFEPTGLAITACRDEEIRVWDIGTGQLHHVFTGHFEEVTGLSIVGHTLYSISIDATVRRWSLAPQDLQKAIEEAKNPRLLEDHPEPKTDFGLTEEEEAELRAMMEEEEADNLEKMAKDEQ